jgi:hypothetical protein
MMIKATLSISKDDCSMKLNNQKKGKLLIRLLVYRILRWKA